MLSAPCSLPYAWPCTGSSRRGSEQRAVGNQGINDDQPSYCLYLPAACCPSAFWFSGAAAGESSPHRDSVRVLRVRSIGRVDAFRQRLRELGYEEGKNIAIEYRYADGKLERLPDLAAELVGLKVDVIVTIPQAISAAQKASPTIPIVFALHSDPVGTGIVSSLARPGGNITGLSAMAPDLDGKRLELLKEAFPKAARVAFLRQATGMRADLYLTQMEAAAKALGVKLLSLPVRNLEDFESAFARAKRDGAQALITSIGGLITTQQRQVLDFAAKDRLPAMYPASEFVEAGGLMSYAPSYTDLFRRAADFVDKILKGAKPADMPVEQATKFEFVVNMNAAKQIGLTIPQKVLARADKVIK